jgi:hypothetical protein
VQYKIVVTGNLDPRWAPWFEGFAVTSEPNHTTVLRGEVVDQAALHGLLQKLRDAGIPLLELTRLDQEGN